MSNQCCRYCSYCSTVPRIKQSCRLLRIRADSLLVFYSNENNNSCLDVDTLGMVALAALGTADEPALQIVAQTTAHHTDVLLEHKLVRVGQADHLVVLLQVLRLQAGLTLRPLQAHHTCVQEMYKLPVFRSVSDPDSGVFWIRLRNQDPGS